jgi:hypothetical protein
LTPRSFSVTTTAILRIITTAEARATTSASDMANSAAWASVGGSFHDHSPSPNTGRIIPARRNISAARGTAREVIHAAARAYHKE